jgi:anti-sigma factor RsiW
MRNHPRPDVLSRYLEGDLDALRRQALEAHVRGCPRCQGELESLSGTVRALRSLGAKSPSGVADSIIAALRSEDRHQPSAGRPAPDSGGQRVLTVLAGARQPRARQPIPNRWAQQARVALSWCLQRPQLRLTLPITMVAGVVLSLANMGGMLVGGKIDVSVCLICATDFVVPFIALNVGLLMLVRLPRRGRL